MKAILENELLLIISILTCSIVLIIILRGRSIHMVIKLLRSIAVGLVISYVLISFFHVSHDLSFIIGFGMFLILIFSSKIRL